MSKTSMFWVMWENVVKAHKVPDFLGFQKNKKCVFPLTIVVT